MKHLHPALLSILLTAINFGLVLSQPQPPPNGQADPPDQPDDCIDVFESCPSCLNGGTFCGSRCLCTPGFTGKYCETDVNASFPVEVKCGALTCQHGANCTSDDTCVCSTFYNGSECENIQGRQICFCLNGGYYNLDYRSCICPDGFNGSFCERPFNPECTRCLNEGIFNGSHCLCREGYGGYFCEKFVGAECNCNTRGWCVMTVDDDGQQSYRCHCSSRFYYGDRCENVHPCASVTCINGECDRDTATCVCSEGWTGPRCKHSITEACLCINGHCMQGTCECHAGWTGVSCATDMCEVIDLACPVNSYCRGGECQCYMGWSGENCTQLDGTNCGNYSCFNNGSCQYDEFGQVCHCRPPFAGDNCTETLSTTPCNNITCMNGGECVNGACRCSYPYQGDTCSELYLCSPGCRENGGFCQMSSNEESFVGYCICPPGMSGVECDTPIRDVLPACGEQVCFNGATAYCNNYTGRCLCRHPFTGRYCEEVVENPCFCMNGGTLNAEGDMCICAEGFTGPYCGTSTNEPAPVYCEREELEEADRTWTWPRTAADQLASLQCPCEARPELTDGVRAVRLCLPNGEWANANVKTCFSEVQRLLCNVSYSGSVLDAVNEIAANPQLLSAGDVALALRSLSVAASTLPLNNTTVVAELLDDVNSLLAAESEVLIGASGSSNAADVLHDLLNDIADGILLSSETDGIVIERRGNFQLFLQQVNLTSPPEDDVPIIASAGHTAPVTASLTAAAFTQVETECDASYLKAAVINQGDIFEGLDNTTVVSVVLTVDLGDCVVEGQEEVIRMTFSNVQSSGEGEIMCSFRDPTLNGGLGGWSSEGCTTTELDSSGSVECSCTHLTAFAIVQIRSGTTTTPTGPSGVLTGQTLIIIIAVSVSAAFLCVLCALVLCLCCMCCISRRGRSKADETHEMFTNAGAPSSFAGTTFAVEYDGSGKHDPKKPLLTLDAGYEKAMEASVEENPMTLTTI